jgi:sterol desaturase/sphingolipid hydroxylase (fatty acid hydroxylase superfamily)
MDFIALSVPAFFILISLEFFTGIVYGRNLYRFNDAVTNLSCGIGSQILGAFVAIVVFWAYSFTYTHFRLFTLPETIPFWFLLFFGVDFAYYWFHRFSHEVNAIWATHIVHHQSEEYNLSVALRQSWFQGLFSWWFYLPLAFLGFSPLMIVTVGACNTLYQFWIHTKAIRKLPAPIEFIFNTPSHHRVHHGTNPEYIDKNHAGSLIIWDRLFGTFTEEKAEVVYGITTPLKSFNPFWANVHYWKELWESAKKTEKLSDKINVFLKPPGWFPQDIGGYKAPPPVISHEVKKFDIAIPKSAVIYTLVHFFAILGITSYYMFFSKNMIRSGNPETVLLAFYMACLILFSLFTFGLILESRASAEKWELLRLIFSAGLIYFFRDNPFLFGALSLFTVFYFFSLATFWYSGLKKVGN